MMSYIYVRQKNYFKIVNSGIKDIKEFVNEAIENELKRRGLNNV